MGEGLIALERAFNKCTHQTDALIPTDAMDSGKDGFKQHKFVWQQQSQFDSLCTLSTLDMFAIGKVTHMCEHDRVRSNIYGVYFICGGVLMVSQSCKPKEALWAHVVDVGCMMSSDGCGWMSVDCK